MDNNSTNRPSTQQDESVISFIAAQRAKFPPAFDLKTLSRKWAKEAIANLNRNLMAEAEADEKAKQAKTPYTKPPWPNRHR